jgi:hypothetical protein
MTALDHVRMLSPQAQIAFYSEKAAHYQKLAKHAHTDGVRETPEAVARDFVARAKAVQA